MNYWVPFESKHAGKIWCCSACDIGSSSATEYCPHCGVKMDAILDSNQICNLALEKYGYEKQITMVFEEMSELQKELCRFLRGKNNINAIAEEMADVQIMLQQMNCLFECADLVSDYKMNKLRRLEEHLNGVNSV